MRILLGVTIMLLLILACKEAGKPAESAVERPAVQEPSQPVNAVGTNTGLNTILSQEQAQKILGTAVSLVDSSTARRYTILAHQGTFKSAVNDGSLYYLIEEYQHQPDAVNKYAFIKASNETSQGFKALKGVGDEAYFHSDGSSFYYAMIRRGKRVFSMKVNKVTGTTSLEDFNRVVEEVGAKL